MDLLTILRHQWDRMLAWFAIITGILLLLLGWLGVSREVVPAAQLPYIISGGLGGLVAVSVGAVLWLSADLRDEWQQLHEIAELLGESRQGDASDVAALAGDGAQRTETGGAKRDADDGSPTVAGKSAGRGTGSPGL
jgi:hypothetical protein